MINTRKIVSLNESEYNFVRDADSYIKREVTKQAIWDKYESYFTIPLILSPLLFYKFQF